MVNRGGIKNVGADPRVRPKTPVIPESAGNKIRHPGRTEGETRDQINIIFVGAKNFSPLQAIFTSVGPAGGEKLWIVNRE